MKKALSVFLAILVGGTITVFGNPLISKAEAIFELSFQPRGGNVTDGYLNSTNLSFRALAYLPDYTIVKETELLIDDDPFPLPIFGSSTEEPGYIEFLSGTMSFSGLQAQVSGGEHVLSVKKTFLPGETGSPVEGSLKVIADYTLPVGTIAPSPLGGVLKIGDTAEFTLDVSPDSTNDIDSVFGSYNGRELSWVVSAPGSFIGQYIVAPGDPDQIVPIQIENVIISDLAGNTSDPVSSADVDFTIDANAPMVAIASPVEGKNYNQNQVLLDYLVDDPTAVVDLTLDGAPLALANGSPITGLGDGEHTLIVEATDLAGNTTVVASVFIVDTIAPYLSLTTGPDGGKIEQGSKIIFEGTSEPGAGVKLEIFSEPLVWTTVADQAGNWRFEISSDELGIGSHDAFITVYDLAGNALRVRVATFEVTAKPVIAQEPIKVARAEEVVVDVAAAQCAGETCKLPPQEVAKEGQILSSEDAKATGINWSAWIILLAIIVLASALATAGYYGYGWALQAANQTRTAKIGDLESKLGQKGGLDALIQAQRKKSTPPDKVDKEPLDEEEPPSRPPTRW
ncbi:MAG: Ig-like domain-containing protein [Candidatus Berkelbacteria bacterium]|nr:Ig-like domain-containing protein [Candidatus Berkelbacteria bacterium]